MNLEVTIVPLSKIKTIGLIKCFFYITEDLNHA